MYEARVVSVMVAGPSDVQEEVAQAFELVAEWNSVHSRAESAVAMPLHWGIDSYPKMGAAAQSIINDELLLKSDMLVAIFWNRIGSPTENYASGTIEEIERHISSGKPVLVYFSTRPVDLSGVDLEQYRSLTAFKDSLGERGLYDTFKDLGEFKDKLRKHLTHHLRELLAGDQPSTESHRRTSVSLTEESVALLRAAAESDHGDILVLESLGGTQIQAGDRVLLPHGSSRRDEARWLAGVDQLFDYELLEGLMRGGSRLTSEGYSVVDQLNERLHPTSSVPSKAPDVRVLYWSKSNRGIGSGLIVHNIGDDVALNLEGQRLMSTGAFEISRSLNSLNAGERGALSVDWSTAPVPLNAPKEVPDGKYMTRVLYDDRDGMRRESVWTVTDKRD